MVLHDIWCSYVVTYLPDIVGVTTAVVDVGLILDIVESAQITN